MSKGQIPDTVSFDANVVTCLRISCNIRSTKFLLFLAIKLTKILFNVIAVGYECQSLKPFLEEVSSSGAQ